MIRALLLWFVLALGPMPLHNVGVAPGACDQTDVRTGTPSAAWTSYWIFADVPLRISVLRQDRWGRFHAIGTATTAIVPGVDTRVDITHPYQLSALRICNLGVLRAHVSVEVFDW